MQNTTLESHKQGTDWFYFGPESVPNGHDSSSSCCSCFA